MMQWSAVMAKEYASMSSLITYRGNFCISVTETTDKAEKPLCAAITTELSRAFYRTYETSS